MKRKSHVTTNKDALRDCNGLLISMLAHDNNFTEKQRRTLQQISREIGSLSELMCTGYLETKELPASHLQIVCGK